MSAPTKERERALPRKRGRSVPLLFGVLSLVLIAFALTFALSSPPPTTPPLAEVVPAPQEQLDVERVEQSSRFGEGAGGEGECVAGDEGCEGASAEALPEDGLTNDAPEVAPPGAAADFWPCLNGPGGPRQTEDPQSPPCIGARFEGDNGGSTWRGVTATEIRFGFDASGVNGEVSRYHLERFVGHFNRRYERYGRRITLVGLDLSGNSSDPAVQRAHARQVIDAEVFAVESYGRLGPFVQEVADAGVITFVDGYVTGPVAEADLAPHHPHVWSVYPSLEEGLAATGDLVCGALAGRPARHGGAEVRDQVRRFGLIVNGRGSHYGPSVLTNAMEACGSDFVVEPYEDDRSDAEQVLRRFQADDVTTVVCVCASLDRRFTEAADAIDYEPEWLLPGATDRDVVLRTNAFVREQHPRRQLAHAFGLAGTLRWPDTNPSGGYRIEEQYWSHAARESDPDYDCRAGSAGVGCHNPTGIYGSYAQLLILASGIQWAGPELTPETFGDALAGLTYPNPNVGRAPWYQPSVGFGPADHGLNSDFSLFWWRDPDDAGYEAKTDHGEICYVGDGRRFVAGTIPQDADDLFFNLEAGCR